MQFALWRLPSTMRTVARKHLLGSEPLWSNIWHVFWWVFCTRHCKGQVCFFSFAKQYHTLKNGLVGIEKLCGLQESSHVTCTCEAKSPWNCFQLRCSWTLIPKVNFGSFKENLSSFQSNSLPKQIRSRRSSRYCRVAQQILFHRDVSRNDSDLLGETRKTTAFHLAPVTRLQDPDV